jgi:excisionase family DNA binding protein
MNMQNLRLEDLPKATEKIYEKICRIEAEIQKLNERLAPNEEDQLLTRKEAAKYLGVTVATVWRWSKNGNLPYYGIGNRVYYKRSEVESALIKLS